jgi:hypothetical protein
MARVAISWVAVLRSALNHCPQPKLWHQRSACSPFAFAR